MSRIQQCCILMFLAIVSVTLIGGCATTRPTEEIDSSLNAVQGESSKSVCEQWQAWDPNNKPACVDRCRPGEIYAKNGGWKTTGRGRADLCVSPNLWDWAYQPPDSGVTTCPDGTIPNGQGYCASICEDGYEWSGDATRPCKSRCAEGLFWNHHLSKCEAPECKEPKTWNPETGDCECPEGLLNAGTKCLERKEAPPEPEPTKAPKRHN